MAKMSMQFGLEKGYFCKRPFRWLFYIPEVAPDEQTSEGAKVLPPQKSARPNLQFKEMNVNHWIEEVFYPAKPDWKPITLTLFDLAVSPHPVFEWIKRFYKPEHGIMHKPNDRQPDGTKFINECILTMYDGCGDIIEQWIYEDAWLQSVNFLTLDMSDSGILTCEITLRYARAYVKENINQSSGSPSAA